MRRGGGTRRELSISSHFKLIDKDLGWTAPIPASDEAPTAVEDDIPLEDLNDSNEVTEEELSETDVTDIMASSIIYLPDEPESDSSGWLDLGKDMILQRIQQVEDEEQLLQWKDMVLSRLDMTENLRQVDIDEGESYLAAIEYQRRKIRKKSCTDESSGNAQKEGLPSEEDGSEHSQESTE